MSRIHRVASARKTKNGRRPHCRTCREPILVGQAYAWSQANRFSSKISWHETCKAPPASELEGNEKRATAMAAFEAAYAELSDLDPADYSSPEELVDAIRGITDTCAEGVREAAEMWRESAQNIEDGFGHSTFASEECNERADEYDGYADQIESVPDDMDDYDEGEWNDLGEWLEATINSAIEALGDAEQM